MACERVPLPGGGHAIVCGTRARKLCAYGRRADRLCDWKVSERRSGTCDAPVCASCALSPAPDKDLCPTHAAAFRDWQARKTERTPA